MMPGPYGPVGSQGGWCWLPQIVVAVGGSQCVGICQSASRACAQCWGFWAQLMVGLGSVHGAPIVVMAVACPCHHWGVMA